MNSQRIYRAKSFLILCPGSIIQNCSIRMCFAHTYGVLELTRFSDKGYKIKLGEFERSGDTWILQLKCVHKTVLSIGLFLCQWLQNLLSHKIWNVLLRVSKLNNTKQICRQICIPLCIILFWKRFGNTCRIQLSTDSKKHKLFFGLALFVICPNVKYVIVVLVSWRKFYFSVHVDHYDARHFGQQCVWLPFDDHLKLLQHRNLTSGCLSSFWCRHRYTVPFRRRCPLIYTCTSSSSSKVFWVIPNECVLI